MVMFGTHTVPSINLNFRIILRRIPIFEIADYSKKGRTSVTI